MRRTSILIASIPVAVAALAALSGCGDSKPSPPPGTIAMREYEFSPKRLTVNRGATITVANEGEIAHNLVIEKHKNPLDKVEKLIGTDTFLGDRSERLLIDLPSGTYTIVSSVPGQRQLGMYGTLTVR